MLLQTKSLKHVFLKMHTAAHSFNRFWNISGPLAFGNNKRYSRQCSNTRCGTFARCARQSKTFGAEKKNNQFEAKRSPFHSLRSGGEGVDVERDVQSLATCGRQSAQADSSLSQTTGNIQVCFCPWPAAAHGSKLSNGTAAHLEKLYNNKQKKKNSKKKIGWQHTKGIFGSGALATDGCVTHLSSYNAPPNSYFFVWKFSRLIQLMKPNWA